MSLSAGDWVRQMQAESFGSAIGPPGIVDDGSPGELVGFTNIDAWAPLEALARLQQEESVVLVDPWKFFEQMRDGRRAGLGSHRRLVPIRLLPIPEVCGRAVRRWLQREPGSG